VTGLEIERILIDIERDRAEIRKLVQETGHIGLRVFLEPFLAAVGFMAAVGTVVKVFF